MVALTSGVSLFFSRASDLQGQNKEDVRKAFRGLRNDHIRYDCSRAAYWLYKHREALRDQMLEELYATKDAQARDVLLDLLFATNRFVPDEKFARFVVSWLREEDTRVSKGWCTIPSRNLGDDSEPDALTRTTYEFEDSYLGSFLGPNGLTTKFLKENEEEPPEPEWIKEYTENYFVVERYP